ncbi:Fe2+ or Zn2+ uptake regulation protein [Candidatus Electrothrix marina]|uniref:Fe2+ or Zn2+ uptake regulation protein n=1 Tax=Candidatus Electrothrix marina TaxID=1859130 RepID=A0A444J7K8_9BACT|nr:Fe2+ or Zn2+ uptake regulation protein [Candidatus Electrothrix marina]RWX52128.1 Fe2+ or Zn2+ uptake regulation protein [Candidatus Electrothrix marina]
MKNILRMTHQRELILEELGNCHNHPTADALYERIKKKLPRISLATVYRNLEILSEAGMIRKLEISGRQKRFDKEIEQHDHIFCVQCRRVDDIKFDQSRLFSLEEEQSQGYKISGCRVEFYGVCPKCQTKNRKKQAGKGECNGGGVKITCKKKGLSGRQREVLEVLAKSDDVCANKDIAAVTSLDPKQISCQLTALKKKGFVASPVRCKYKITEAGKAAF